MEVPKMRDVMWLFVAAAMCAAIAWKVKELPEWLRIFLIVMAIVFGFFAISKSVDYLTFLFVKRWDEVNHARTSAAMDLAYALRGLTGQQTDLVSRFGFVTIAGILGESEIFWTVRAPGGDIPLDFIRDLINASMTTEPYVIPVRQHDKYFSDWLNSEELAKITTNLFIHRGWAEKSKGPYPARLLIGLDAIADKFGFALDLV